MSDINYSDWNMKLGNLILKPPGKATGCLLVTRLESAPGVMWGPGGPKCPAPCAGTLPPTHPTSHQLWKARRLEGRGSGDWSESPCQGEWKEKKNPFLLNQWCPTVQPHALSLFTFVLKVAQRIQLSAFFITAHVLLPHSPKPVVFSTLRQHRHPFHLSNYIHFQTDVLWQSYKALTSLFLIN